MEIMNECKCYNQLSSECASQSLGVTRTPLEEFMEEEVGKDETLVESLRDCLEAEKSSHLCLIHGENPWGCGAFLTSTAFNVPGNHCSV